MMKRYPWMLLGLLPLLQGCPKRGPDYDGVRQRAKEAHQGAATETGPVERR